MPDYRRWFVPGGTYFFTVKTECNVPIFREPGAVSRLGHVLREARRRWPFQIVAIVLLPDHVHAIWSLPPGDAAYSRRWAWIKKEFAKSHAAGGGIVQTVSESRARNRRLGVWQRRFWEHALDDERDLESHFDYIHWNPVKHGYVRCPREWPHSSFHRWVAAGVYPADWGCGDRANWRTPDLHQAGE